MAKSKNRPKLADVAKLAGVSGGTVSVVLNNRVGDQVRVSEATQQKIWHAVRQLGYVANPVAQSLAGGENRIIAVFTFESIFPIDSRNFYFPFLVGIEEEADHQGYDILLVTGSNGASNGVRQIYQNSANRLKRADGAILLGHGKRSEVEKLLDESYPFVFVGKRNSNADMISYVAADYRSATVDLIEHLLKLGHKRIVYIRSNRDTEASADREEGVRVVLSNPGESSSTWLWQGEPEALSTEIVADRIEQGTTAFVTEDDELGSRLLIIARQLGLSVPDDFSLAVLGNPLSPLVEVPNWTGFSIPRRQMGQEAFKLLLSLLKQSDEDHATPLRTTLSCQFVPGDTVRQA